MSSYRDFRDTYKCYLTFSVFQSEDICIAFLSIAGVDPRRRIYQTKYENSLENVCYGGSGAAFQTFIHFSSWIIVGVTIQGAKQLVNSCPSDSRDCLLNFIYKQWSVCLVSDKIWTCAVFIMSYCLGSVSQRLPLVWWGNQGHVCLPRPCPCLLIGLKSGCRVSQFALGLLSIARTFLFLSGCFILIVNKLKRRCSTCFQFISIRHKNMSPSLIFKSTSK